VLASAARLAGSRRVGTDPVRAPREVAGGRPDRLVACGGGQRLAAGAKRGAQAAPNTAEHGSGLGKTRWVVERSLSWFRQFRRLRVRRDRWPDIHEAFLSLACILICCAFAVRLL